MKSWYFGIDVMAAWAEAIDTEYNKSRRNNETSLSEIDKCRAQEEELQNVRVESK